MKKQNFKSLHNKNRCESTYQHILRPKSHSLACSVLGSDADTTCGLAVGEPRALGARAAAEAGLSPPR